jgi:F0F1-type ATP synthase assembly protein I
MKYAGLATQWLVMLLVAVYLGMKLDGVLHWKAGFVIVLPLVALGVSLWQIIKEFTKPKE